jgi:signal transduction histidine kinase
VLSYLSVVVAVLVLLEVPLGILTDRHERDLLGVQAVQQATGIAVLSAEDLERGRPGDLAQLARSYRSETNGEVLVVDGSQRVAADSDDDGAADLARLRSVVVGAQTGRDVTASATDEGMAVILAAVPIRNYTGAAPAPGSAAAGSGLPATGVVVLSLPAAATFNRVHDVWYGLALFALVVLVLTALLGVRVARSVTRPLALLESAVGRLGAGDLAGRATPAGPSELRALATEFNRMAARIEDLLTAQSRFVADASHQLRSPLTALRLRLENLQADLRGASAASAAAAGREVQRLSRLVDGLLTLSRADAAPAERRPVDVAAVIAERVDAWESLAAERGVTLVAPANRLRHPQAPLVPGDLDQLLDNLLANALDATPQGRGIAVEVSEAETSITITVTDEGPGMSEQELARAFDRFWQGSSRAGSSGLGLAIVRQLARRNGATVELRPAGAARVALATSTGAPRRAHAVTAPGSDRTASSPAPSPEGGRGLQAAITLIR